MAKAKEQGALKKEVSDTTAEIITKDEVKESNPEPSAPISKASNVEKIESFTAAFKNDAHSAADYFVSSKEEVKEEISREESSTSDGGVKGTVTYK